MPNSSTLIILLSGLMLMFSATTTLLLDSSLIPNNVILALSFFVFFVAFSELFDSESAKNLLVGIGVVTAFLTFVVTEVQSLDEKTLEIFAESMSLLSLGLTIFMLGLNDIRKIRR